MERKLELADIAGYLPYGLKWGYLEGNSYHVIYTYLHIDPSGIEMPLMGGYLPVLRPMSDLVKPMTHPYINDGGEFVPMIYIAIFVGGMTEQDAKDAWDTSFTFEILDNLELDLTDSVKLLSILNKLHFDYNDLIGQGLAIDINTIE